MFAAGPSWSLWAKRLSVRSVRGTRLTHQHARRRGSRNSYAKHELLDAADSGRARSSPRPAPPRRLTGHPTSARAHTPRGRTPARDPARAGGGDEAIVLTPGKGEGNIDPIEPREPPRPHPAVRGLEPRRVRIRPHEPHRVLVRHTLPDAPPSRATPHGVRASSATPAAAPARTPVRRAAPRTASDPAAQAIVRPARSPSPTVPSPPAPSPARPSRPERSRRRRTPPAAAPAAPSRARTASRTHRATAALPPKPGMSTATTSSPNKGSTGSQTRWSAPSGCSRTSINTQTCNP